MHFRKISFFLNVFPVHTVPLCLECEVSKCLTSHTSDLGIVLDSGNMILVFISTSKINAFNALFSTYLPTPTTMKLRLHTLLRKLWQKKHEKIAKSAYSSFYSSFESGISGTMQSRRPSKKRKVILIRQSPWNVKQTHTICKLVKLTGRLWIFSQVVLIVSNHPIASSLSLVLLPAKKIHRLIPDGRRRCFFSRFISRNQRLWANYAREEVLRSS